MTRRSPTAEPAAFARLRALESGLSRVAERVKRRDPEPVDADAERAAERAEERAAALDGGLDEAAAAGLTITAPGRQRRRRRLLVAAATFVAILALGALVLLVMPTRAWLHQRDAIADAQRRLAIITAENTRLEQRADALQTPEEIARVAREEYNRVRPGDQAVAILPASTPSQLPQGWPFDAVAEIVLVRKNPPVPAAPTTGG